MTKEEFESKLGRKVSDPDYKEIEYVYTWHPAVSETDGKEQVARLYDAGGIAVIREMRQTSSMAQGLLTKIAKVRRELDSLNMRYERLRGGDNSLERCINAIFPVMRSESFDEEEKKEMEGLLEAEFSSCLIDEAKEIVKKF